MKVRREDLFIKIINTTIIIKYLINLNYKHINRNRSIYVGCGFSPSHCAGKAEALLPGTPISLCGLNVTHTFEHGRISEIFWLNVTAWYSDVEHMYIYLIYI